LDAPRAGLPEWHAQAVTGPRVGPTIIRVDEVEFWSRFQGGVRDGSSPYVATL